MPKKKTKIVFETFQDVLADWCLAHMRADWPSCHNGKVRVRKFRVTIEPLDEPPEVLQERLVHLWEHSDNTHHSDPLRAAMRRLGGEFTTYRGCKREKRDKS